MLVFLDTEFTDFQQPELLSIGIVTESGEELYIELDLQSELGKRRSASSNEFVSARVLNQWHRFSGATCKSDEEMGGRAADWLLELARRIGGGIDVIYYDKTDADLLELALKAAGVWPASHPLLHFAIVSYLRGNQVVEAAMAASWANSGTLDGLKRHHALADARALRAGFHAMHSASEEAAVVDANIANAAARKREQWLAENADAIESSNAWVEEHGLPLENSRLF